MKGVLRGDRGGGPQGRTALASTFTAGFTPVHGHLEGSAAAARVTDAVIGEVADNDASNGAAIIVTAGVLKADAK
jgi:hypothetical protein